MPPPVSISAKDLEEVLRTFDREGLLEAVLLVHRALDLELLDITRAVEPMLRHTGRMGPLPDPDVAASVFATGRFRRDLVAHMDYGEDLHAQTREGAPVIVCFLSSLGAFEAEVLALCLGAEAWDFDTHAIVPERVRIDDLAALYMDEGLRTRFFALRDAGYQFHYHLEPT
jgi:hypothetical protein